MHAHAAMVRAGAADLDATPLKPAKVRVIHPKRLAVVRDYDGTPVVMRPVRRVVLRGDDAAVMTAPRYVMLPAPRAIPARYLNGEPVRPTNRLLRRWR